MGTFHPRVTTKLFMGINLLAEEEKTDKYYLQSYFDKSISGTGPEAPTVDALWDVHFRPSFELFRQIMLHQLGPLSPQALATFKL